MINYSEYKKKVEEANEFNFDSNRTIGLGLSKIIEDIVDGYRSNNDSQRMEMISAADKIKENRMLYTQEGMKEVIRNKLNEIRTDWIRYNNVLNQRVKAEIKTTKKKFMKDLELVETEKAADYAMRINNAREFVMLELKSNRIDNLEVLDNNLYRILKDFQKDHNTMRIFLNMVETVVKIHTATGIPALPKTFGSTMEIESIMNTFDELEKDSEKIFIGEKLENKEIGCYGELFQIPNLDSYWANLDIYNVRDNAKILDNLVEYYYSRNSEVEE